MDLPANKIMEDELLPELEMSIVPRKRGKVRVELMNISPEFKQFLIDHKVIDVKDVHWDMRDIPEPFLGKFCKMMREKYREFTQNADV